MANHWDAPQRRRGRAGVEQRRRRLAAHPLCAECTKLGRVTPSDEIDHIIPLAQGGTDTEDNVQGLCTAHHLEKTALEDVSHQAAANHPDWLDPSGIPVTIVCGPPASGKTTYVQRHAGIGDVVIDIDAIRATLHPGFQPWADGDTDSTLLNKAIRVRNALLGGLKRRTEGRAWLIVSAPSQAERDWWARKLGGTIVLLGTSINECKRRAIARGTPNAVQGIDTWARKAKERWEPKRPPPTIGLDGWPVERS